MDRRIAVLALMLLLASAWLPATADPGRVELFLRNRPFSGESRVLRGEVYAVLEDLLTALDLSWTRQDHLLLVWSRPGGGPALTGPPLPLVLDGRNLRVPQEAFAGKVWVSVADFARTTGARYTWNRQAGSADFFPAAFVARHDSPNRVVTDGRGSNGSPLRLEGLSWRVEGDPPRMRGFAVLRNAGATPLREVVLVLEVQDDAGRSCGGFSWSCGDLPPGKDLTWQFPIWTDYESVRSPRPILRMEHRRS
jgi:hypothetical protein